MKNKIMNMITLLTWRSSQHMTLIESGLFCIYILFDILI
jgi:hypothetical protein